MKKFTLTAMAILALFAAHAQKDTAMDFTKTDCNGTSHHLFAELDSGNVVILEYAMLPGCQPCITANHTLEPIIDRYKISHPGKVRSYVIGFNNSYTCPTMQSWKTDNSIKSTAFINGSTEVSYYGGFGMPTIVVAGGPQHKVYFTTIGFATGDTTQVNNSIKKALSLPTGITEINSAISGFTVYPNPVVNTLNISFTLKAKSTVTFTLFDLAGRNVYSSPSHEFEAGENVFSFENPDLNSGYYLLKIEGGTFSSSQKITVIK